MKKQYLPPTMTVMTLHHQHILCTSDLQLNGETVTGGWSKEISNLNIYNDEEW